MIVPFFDALRQYKNIKDYIDEAVERVLSSGRYVLGEEGKKFESEFASYIGMSYGIGVNSGTDAIKIALKSFGIGEGDEVITVANTAVPTVSAIRETGAMPVFVDIDEYFTLNSKLLEKAVTKKTKAIVPVHLYGQSCDMEKIMAVAKKYSLIVIEDCAQSAGAEFKVKKTGTWGDASCFSFYPTKNLGAMGDGGIILTGSKEISDRAKELRMYGMKETYFSEIEGFNSRLDEIQAGILRAKLPYLDEWNKKRSSIADFYKKNIENPKIELPKIREGAKHIFHLFVIRSKEREALKEHMKKKQYRLRSALRPSNSQTNRLLIHQKIQTGKYRKDIRSNTLNPDFPGADKRRTEIRCRCSE